MRTNPALDKKQFMTWIALMFSMKSCCLLIFLPAGAVWAVLWDGLHIPALQDLCWEWQGCEDWTLQAPDVYVLSDSLAGETWLYCFGDYLLTTVLSNSLSFFHILLIFLFSGSWLSSIYLLKALTLSVKTETCFLHACTRNPRVRAARSAAVR